MKISIWRITPLVLFLILAILLYRGLFLQPGELPSVKIGTAVPQFKLSELNHPDKLVSPDYFKGKITLLNVWASWCHACIEEQTFLLQLADSGVNLFGLNYKDNADNARKWLIEWGNPYRIIAQDLQGTAAIDLGVYGAPETFLIDQKGTIRYRHTGILTEKVWQEIFQPLIRKLERRS